MAIPPRARRAILLLGMSVAITAGYRLFAASGAAHRHLGDEASRQAELDQIGDWTRWRMEGKATALREYADGRATLIETARRFQEFDGGDEREAARLHRGYPSATSDEERYAADVLACFARRVGTERGDDVIYRRAANDYRRTYGEPPVPVKL